MAISSADPSFLVIYGCNESAPAATRANSGSLGTAQDLTPYQASGTDGILAVPDGAGGKAAWLDTQYPVPYSTMTAALRYLRGPAAASGAVHAALPDLPISSAADDWAAGVRFKWIGGETDGPAAIERQVVFGLMSISGNTGFVLGFTPQIAANPAADARLNIRIGDSNYDLNGASFTITNSPATYYVLPDVWYRLTIRVYFSATGYVFKVYLYNESTAVTYTWTLNTPATADWTASFLAAADTRVVIGGPVNQAYVYVDDAWIFDAPMTDGDALSIVSSGISIPWSEPNYSQLDHAPYATVARGGSSFPKPRALPVGGMKARHPVNVRGSRLKVRYSGYRPGRPCAMRSSQVIFDSVGPRPGRTDEPQGFLKFDAGWVRGPGTQPPNSLADGRNVTLRGGAPRSRKGFRVRRDVATVDAANGFISYRDLNDSLFRLYKISDALYAELGTSAVSIDTGWSSTHLPSYGVLNGRAVILTPNRQKTHRSSLSAVESFGIAAPAAPTTALAAGTLTGTYYYAYTEYDPTTGDESAPGVAAATVSPAAQGVTLTLAAVSSDTRFTRRRIYRSTSGGGVSTMTLLATINTATTYTDSAGVDGTDAIDAVDGTYITGTPPDTFSAVTIHRERAFYYGGTTYPNRVYRSEAGTLQRFYANAYTEHEANVRCVIARGQSLIVFTDSSVEIMESDWGRDDLGSYNIQRTVVSRTVGCFGHKAAVNAHGQVFWIDSRGAWTLDGDTPTPISEQINGIFPYINTNLKHRVVAAYNHIERQIWFSVALGGTEFQSDTSRTSTVLVYQLDRRIWCPPYRIEVSYADQFDDDLNGIQFGVIDQLGVFKQMETYEGDGVDGSETFTFEGTVSTLTSRVLTPVSAPTGWTANLFRGFGIVLVDSVTGAEFATTVSSNGTGTLTLAEDPGAGFGNPDLFYLGGILWYFEPAEQDFGTTNEKVARFLISEFDDISTARIV